jgi:hypothetical protein
VSSRGLPLSAMLRAISRAPASSGCSEAAAKSSSAGAKRVSPAGAGLGVRGGGLGVRGGGLGVRGRRIGVGGRRVRGGDGRRFVGGGGRGRSEARGGVRLELREPLDEALAGLAQRGQQAVEVGLEGVELGEHGVGGRLDAGDVVGGLGAGGGAHLGGAALGGLEDQADLLGGAARQRGRGGVEVGFELVGDAAEVLVHRRGLIAAPSGWKVATLDPVPIHDRSG